MAIPIELLIAKADGILLGFSKSTPKEREASPTKTFCEDYNKLRSLAVERLPDLADAFPPEVEIFTSASEIVTCHERYAEILGYVNQIRGILVRTK